MLDITLNLPVAVQNGGHFISRGRGHHPARVLDSWELIFVEKGTLLINENDRAFSVGSGESLLLWPYRNHVGVGNFPPDLQFYWLHFQLNGDIKQEFLSSEIINIPQHTRVRDAHAITALFRQFLSEQENIHSGQTLALLLLIILQKIAEFAGAESPVIKNEEGMALAYKAQQLIRTQFHLPLCTSKLAKELHCSADYLGRVYRRIFQLTITEAIHRQRIISAKELLVNDICPLSEVAARCGFNDPGYFRRIFRKQAGLMPAQWRRRYSKEHINSN